MELNDKLRQLRKDKGWTQEELAEALFVSRTAVSKWESGRGYPSIDSLKAISKLFSVSVDDLISSEALISIAEMDQKEKLRDMHSLAFGILDCMVVLLLFLPLFGQLQADGVVRTVPLLAYASDYNFVLIPYVLLIALSVLLGIAQLLLRRWPNRLWSRYKGMASLIFSVLLLLFTMLNRQPYPGVLLLCFVAVKTLLLVKRP